MGWNKLNKMEFNYICKVKQNDTIKYKVVL